MLNRKMEAGQGQSAADELFGPQAERSWAGRTVPPPTPAAAEGTPEAPWQGQQALPPVERASYRILRGRMEPLSKLRLISRQGEKMLVDYGCITWVHARSPGELVLRVID